jgi:C4-dicarboxylate transporter DctM subunit
VAVLVLITCKIARVDYNKTNKPLIPVFVALVAVLFVIAFIPWITLAVPRFVGAT